MRFLYRWWWLLALGSLAALIPALLFTRDSANVYKSQVVLLVMHDVEASERLTETYARLIELRPVFTEVKTRLNLPLTEEELDKKTSVTTEFNSQLLTVSVEDADPERASRIANEIATVFVERTDLQTGQPGTVQIVANAIPAKQPSSTGGPIVLVIAVAIGALVGASIGVGMDWLAREA